MGPVPGCVGCRLSGAAVIAAAGVLAACAAPARNSRMTGDDLEQIGRSIADSLTRSDLLAERDASSAPWLVTITKIRNLSSDVMTESEQWAVVARVRSSLSIEALRESKNIRWVIPVEQVERMRADPSGGFGPADSPEFASERRPTHQLIPTFRSLTRADATARTELYYCEFQIVDIETSAVVWSDRFEYKREARGHVWD